jgi:two-component system sensor histidine kinase YesM
MQHFIRKLNDIKLRNKMILSYVFVIIIPLFIVSYLVVNEFRQSALEDAIEQTVNNVERVKQRTTEVLNVSIDLSNRLSLDERLEEVVNRRYEHTFDVVKAYREYETFGTYLDFNKETSKIKLYVDNQTLISNWELFPLEEETERTFWYQSALNGQGIIGWFYFDDITRRANSTLSLVRKVSFPQYQTYGVLVIDINTEYINSMLRQEPFETLLLDENNIVVASNRPNMIGESLSETHLELSIAAQESGAHEVMIDGEASKVYIEDLMPETSYNKLKIISIFSIESIVAESNQISRMGFTVILLSFVVALILIYIICTILAKRLLKLSKQISKVSQGDFNSIVEVDGDDEIGHLSRRFNQMVYSIQNLMDEVQHSNEQKSQLEFKQNEIKLKMLASQINPHFLYNALESIRMKAHLKGEREIAQTVKLLGKLMRKNLEIGGKEYKLMDEIEIIRCYLEIQKFRHGDRLDYQLDIDPAAESVNLPPLIIQPLVENAVVHGLENKDVGGQVTLRVTLKSEFLNIEVTDNGIGMNQVKLQEILESIKDQEADRIGLNNIHQRIQLTYGNQYGLCIDSELHVGTKIQFTVPREVSDV